MLLGLVCACVWGDWITWEKTHILSLCDRLLEGKAAKDPEGGFAESGGGCGVVG